MDTPVYYVQCISGDLSHVMEVIPGGELEEKCKSRAAAGKLDALILYFDECPMCIEDSRERERRNSNNCAEYGCMFMPITSIDPDDDSCNMQCQRQRVLEGIKDSPYDAQLRGLPANA